jgi:tetraacyldisaccharide 4'-kinase
MNVPPPIALLLWPLSLVYGAGARFRAWLYAHGWLSQKRLHRPVISVGNLTVGGTGKTPMVIWLAERFLAEGKRVGILSRGYRGTDGTSDEIELMKQRLGESVLFGVGKNRYVEGQRLEAEGVDVFLLDDGFQHMRLARDVDIVLIDRLQPLSDDRVLPAGRLREPVDAVNRADLVVYTRTDKAERTVRLIQALKKFPIFPASTNLVGFRRCEAGARMQSLAEIKDGTYFAFCGIGNPDGFFLDLKRWGLKIAGQRIFRDHHRYTVAEIREIESAAERVGAQCLVTTEKDFYNLREIDSRKMPLYVCLIQLELRDEKQFFGAIAEKLGQRQAVVV